METLESWINRITVFEILDSAPYGFFMGCEGTARYLAFIFRTKPSTVSDLFSIRRQNLYFNSSINEQYFKLTEIDEFLNELDRRLNFNEYAQVSFNFHKSENDAKINNDIKHDHNKICRKVFEDFTNPSKPILFDHTFIITKDYYRYESYINQYGPKRQYWLNYRNDIKELFENPHTKWEEIFGVKCDNYYDLSKIEILINN
jgi:hypothetical protein